MNDPELEAKYAAWAGVSKRAADAARGELDAWAVADGQADELAAIGQRYNAAMEQIPRNVRAMELAMCEGQRMVAVLTDAGVEFADGAVAPAQLAGAMYGAWRDAGESEQAPPEAWFSLATAMVDAVEHAMDNATGVPDPWRSMAAGKREA
jgi:hypothetical protein